MSAYLVTVRPRTATQTERLYLLAGSLSPIDVERLTTELLCDPVSHIAIWESLDQDLAPLDAPVVEIAYRPGVTDNEAETILIGAQHIGIRGLDHAKTMRRVFMPATTDDAHLHAYALDHWLNDLIETAYSAITPNNADRVAFYQHLLELPLEPAPTITTVALREADDDELQRISRDGILALTLSEMQSIRDYFRREQRDPTDGELETIAQTWSEHCRHKTFRATIEYKNIEHRTKNIDDRGQGSGVRGQHGDAALYPALHELESGANVTIDGLLKQYLMRATNAVRTDQLLSAFVDNAGIVAFDDDYEISFKVETHNHPSALEPFGGANTGVGGVVRDVLGVSAKPIAVTDVLCFGEPDLPENALSEGVLHPRRIREGVIAGVRDYGNKLGIPNINGAIWYDHGYTANPLVFCGTVGIAPRGVHPRNVQHGDAIVVIGGRTGRDGIHGATFSSVELTHDTAETVGAAVQIGDPVTEKTVIDVLLQARELGLYSAITDCGAGGLSSAVGEMGEHTGAIVELRDVPLKYSGLQPWEIWISEAQERMVVAVPPQHTQTLLNLCVSEDVEATVIGQFGNNGYLTVRYAAQTLVNLDMDFLHSGGAKLHLNAEWVSPSSPTLLPVSGEGSNNQTELLKAVLAHPIVASKEYAVRTYDHEVQGATILKPLVGVHEDAPGDAGAIQPRVDSRRGIVLGNGINPRYGKIDPYWMALAAVDEAMRNVVSAGGDPAQTWILDNFCWGDPKLPDRLGGLVRAAAGCYDAALSYKTPFISGKDSLNNEYRDADGNRIAIPPTLLISAMSIVPDVLQTISMDAKHAGNAIYLVGMTRHELGGAIIQNIEHRTKNIESAECRVQSAEVENIEHRTKNIESVEWSGNDELAQQSRRDFNNLDRTLVQGIGQVPQVDLAVAPKIMQAVHQAIRAGLVRSCHDLSEGGLAVAAAEMAFAGELGMTLDLAAVPHEGDLDAHALLWSESPSRFLVEVEHDHAHAFEQLMHDLPHARIGDLTDSQRLTIKSQAGEPVIDADVLALKRAWQGKK